MTIAQLQQLASNSGLIAHVPHTTHTELIRKIQMLRGDEPCFGTDKGSDCAEMCQWRRDCRRLKAAWLR